MASRAPDKVKGGGLFKRKISTSLQKLEQAKKRKSPLDFIITRKQQVNQKKPVSTLQLSTQKRTNTIKQQRDTQRAAIAQQTREKAVRRPVTVRRTTTRKNTPNDVRNADIAKISKNIQTKARGAAAQAAAQATAKLRESVLSAAKVKETAQAFSLKSRLENLNAEHALILTRSNQADAADILQTAGTTHGTIAKIHIASATKIAEVIDARKNAADDNVRQLKEQDNIQKDINAINIAPRKLDVDNAVKLIVKLKKQGSDAQNSAHRGLGMADITLNFDIRPSEQMLSGMKQVSSEKIQADRNVAQKSGEVAGQQNSLRQITKIAEAGQITVRNSYNSQRTDAVRDITTHTGGATAATNRKNENEAALNGLKTEYNKGLSKMKDDADGAAADLNRKFRDADTAAKGPRNQEKLDADKARTDKEGEIGPNANAIAQKGSEIDRAQGHETSAKRDYDKDTQAVSGIQNTLDTQNLTRGKLKPDRDAALDTANANTPKRPPSDEINAARRSEITTKDIPAQDSIKRSSEKEVSDANDSISTANRHKDANNAEIAPMGAVRRDRVAEDTALRRRSDDATAENNNARRDRDEVTADMQNKQSALQNKRRHDDELNSIIATRTLQNKAGVPIVTDASVAIKVTSTRHTASTAAIASGKKHAESAAELANSNKRLLEVSNTLKKTGDEQDGLIVTRDDAVRAIPRETQISDTLAAERKKIPDRIATARTEADIAIKNVDENLRGIENFGSDLDMARDAFNYFDEPLASTRAIITQNNNLSSAAGSTAARQREALTGASDSVSKGRNNQAEADAGRKQSAQDIITHIAGRDASAKRRDDNDTALQNAQKNHNENMGAMRANANDTVTKNRGLLDDAKAAAGALDPIAVAAAKKRSDAETEATTQGAMTASKLDEVNTAKANEDRAKKASDDAATDLAGKQGALSRLIDSETGLKNDRDAALSDADAAKPLRDPRDGPIKARKEVLDGTEIPAARANNIRADRDAAADSLAKLNTQRNTGANDLDAIQKTRRDLETDDANLRGRRDTESKDLIQHKKLRDGVDSKIMEANTSIQKKSNHNDAVENIIETKKLASQSGAPPQSINNIASKQTTTANTLVSNGRKHANAEGALKLSNEYSGRIKGSIDELDSTRRTLNNEYDGVVANKSIESGNRTRRQDELDGVIKKKKDFEKEADEASRLADEAKFNQQDVQGRPGGIDDLKYLMETSGDGMPGNQGRIARDRDAAQAAGDTAAEANIRRNKAASDAEKIKGALSDYDARRKGEAENTARIQREGDAARARKVGDDTNLDNVKKRHNEEMEKIQNDGDSAVKKNKKDLDDGLGSASAQYDASTAATKKRKQAEEDGVTNEADISNKKKDLDKARENELAAKQRTDADDAAVGQHQKDLDASNLQEGPLKKNRDDAAGEANDALPRRSDGDTAKKNRQSDIDADVNNVKKLKDDAEGNAAKDADGLARTKARKEGLPDPEDTKPLRDIDEELQRKRDDEQKNKDELDSESKKNKKEIQDGQIKMALKQNAVGMIAGIIMDGISTKYKLYPPPPPPYIIGSFQYPIAGPSGSSGQASGAKPAGLVGGPSGSFRIVPNLIDISGMGDLYTPDLLGPSGASGASGASDYSVNYNRGYVIGTQDGTRDATSDATDAYANKQDKTLKGLQERIGLLSSAKQSAIDDEIAKESQKAYCKKVEQDGKAQKLDIYTVFSECAKYFEKPPPTTSQPIMLEKIGPSVSEESGAQEGGYSEDLSGVMQFGGELTNSGPVVPSEENDVAYMAGYKAGYKKAYTQTYSLTIAIKITQKAGSEKNQTASAARVEYGEYGETVEQIITASMPVDSGAQGRTPPKGTVTEAEAKVLTKSKPKIKTPKGSKGPVTEAAAKASTTATGPVTEAAAKASTTATGPVTEAAAKTSTTATGPVTEAATESTANATGAQEGGFLKMAKRKYQRGRTLTQHERLLNKIKDKTSVA